MNSASSSGTMPPQRSSQAGSGASARRGRRQGASAEPSGRRYTRGPPTPDRPTAERHHARRRYNAITAEGLVKIYKSRKSEVRALDGLDLEVAEGTVLGLLGPNGAGKTTTVRILATLLKPDAGRATVAGFDVVKQARRSSARSSACPASTPPSTRT